MTKPTEICRFPRGSSGGWPTLCLELHLDCGCPTLAVLARVGTTNLYFSAFDF
jgi:hypothetical protein